MYHMIKFADVSYKLMNDNQLWVKFIIYYLLSNSQHIKTQKKTHAYRYSKIVSMLLLQNHIVLL